MLKELCEDFLMCEASEKFLAFDDQNYEAQDLSSYLEHIGEALLFEEAAMSCKMCLVTKDIDKLLKDLKLLGLENTRNYIINERFKTFRIKKCM